MARITDEYVVMQKRCRSNIDASSIVYLGVQCIRQKTQRNKYVEVLILEKTPFKKILDYYDFGITFRGQHRFDISFIKFLELLKMCNGLTKSMYCYSPKWQK